MTKMPIERFKINLLIAKISQLISLGSRSDLIIYGYGNSSYYSFSMQGNFIVLLEKQNYLEWLSLIF